MSKTNGPIIYTQDFIDNRGMRTLIELQANTQTGTLGNSKNNGNNAPKVKKLDYKRINQPKK